jgi:hypothetical protein
VKKLKVLPAMRCDAGCGECCGVIPVTETEYRRVERFAREHGIVPVDHGASGDKLTCPFYQGGTCAVYEVRPVICRVFGHAADLPCARGYNTDVPQRQVDRMLAANGRPGFCTRCCRASTRRRPATRPACWSGRGQTPTPDPSRL